MTLTSLYNLSDIWDKGITGQGVKVGIFDTGIKLKDQSLNIIQVSDWTNEKLMDDSIGHGTIISNVYLIKNIIFLDYSRSRYKLSRNCS